MCLCDEMLNMVTAILICQQQPIQAQHQCTQEIVFLHLLAHTHTDSLPQLTCPPLIITVQRCGPLMINLISFVALGPECVLNPVVCCASVLSALIYRVFDQQELCARPLLSHIFSMDAS